MDETAPGDQQTYRDNNCDHRAKLSLLFQGWPSPGQARHQVGSPPNCTVAPTKAPGATSRDWMGDPG